MSNRLPDSRRGQLLGGAWDLETVDIQDTSLYRGLHQRFVERRDWIDTELHADRYRVEYENAPRKYLRFSPTELMAHGAKLDSLYHTLLVNGYQPHWKRIQSFETELSVNISREGEILRNAGGLHRIVLSQFLDLPYISLRIVVIHAAWNRHGADSMWNDLRTQPEKGGP